MSGKQSGLGDALWVAGNDLSGDITAIGNVGGGPAVLACTGIDKGGIERLGGTRDGRLEFTAWWDPDGEHPVLSALPTADVIMTYCRGTALGSPAACINAKQPNYDGTRGDDGSFTFQVATVANGYGLEWGDLATAGIRTDTTATNGAGIDGGAASTFGLQAYLHVFGVTGTSVTVKLQHSTDNSTFTDVTGGGFAAATGVGAQRVQTARGLTINRYLRVATTGTFTNAQFAVVICRNPIEVDF